MPSSTIFHAVFFAAGAAIGATAVTLASGRKERLKPVSSKPIVEVGPNGVLTLAKQGMDAGDVLKYGNPGKNTCDLVVTPRLTFSSVEGPISDLICRKAYTLGYDRRLRHPSWVWSLFCLYSFSPSED